jgi:hypothetical protein
MGTSGTARFALVSVCGALGDFFFLLLGWSGALSAFQFESSGSVLAAEIAEGGTLEDL